MVLSTTLSDSQKIVLEDFYRGSFKKVAFNKLERKKIWNEFKKDRNIKKYVYFEDKKTAEYFKKLIPTN